MRYIYITTNTINGKKYLGQRKLAPNKAIEDDKYFGSGNLIVSAIKKYGKDNFTKEIIHIARTQKEADILEIKEIKDRKILENKHIWYNRDAGGQYDRSEMHSELTSKVMLNLYSDDNKYTEIMVKTNRKRYLRGLSPICTTIAQRDINKLRDSLIQANAKVNRKEKTKVLKLIIKHSRVLDPNNRRKGGKSLWSNQRESLIHKQKEAHKRRKEESQKSGSNYFTEHTRIQFMTAKFKQNNNNVGLWLYSKGFVNYKVIGARVQALVTKKYTRYDAYNKMITLIINEIYLDSLVVIDVDDLLREVNVRREAKGLNTLKIKVL